MPRAQLVCGNCNFFCILWFDCFINQLCNRDIEEVDTDIISNNIHCTSIGFVLPFICTLVLSLFLIIHIFPLQTNQVKVSYATLFQDLMLTLQTNSGLGKLREAVIRTA